MATNNILPFCPTSTGTNLLSQGAYAASADRTSGQKPGIASSALNNKALRQASLVASQLAQAVSDKTGVDVLDDGTTATLYGLLAATLNPQPPTIQKFTSGSGTYNKSYVFQIASGSATIGATYTNNAITFTVVRTIASGTVLVATGSGAPAVNGTLTKTSGTGDATLTFYAVKAPLYLRVRMVGAGGGGSGSSDAGAVDGGDGGNTTFGSTFLAANGGKGGTLANSATASVGGSASIAAGAEGLALQGNTGGAYSANTQSSKQGGFGAASIWGGSPANASATSTNAAVNSGAGGQGGRAGSSAVSLGMGGGSGGFVDAVVQPVSATYAYAIGAAGTAGSAGSNGIAGSAGGSGMILVEEFYQ